MADERTSGVWLEREEFEKRGFVTNLERLLLAVDESVNASFAAHLAGLLVGTRGLPITVLHIGRRATEQEKNRGEQDSHEAGVKKAAEAVGESTDDAVGHVDITTTLRSDTAPEAAILQEIKATDVDLVVMGVDRIQAEHLSFGGVADAVIRQSGASVLLVSSGESHRPPDKES